MSFYKRYLCRKRTVVNLLVWLVTIFSLGLWLQLELSGVPLQAAQQELRGHAVVLRELAPRLLEKKEGERDIGRIAEELNTRLTLIGRDGEVVADSFKNPGSLSNHLGRPEIQAAKTVGVGIAERRSESVGIDMLYLALPVMKEGSLAGFARASIPSDRASKYKDSVTGSLIFGLSALGILSVLLFLLFVKDFDKCLRSIAAALECPTGDDEIGERTYQHYSLNMALRKVSGQLRELQDQWSALSRQTAQEEKLREDLLQRAEEEVRSSIGGVQSMIDVLSSTPLNLKQRRFVELSRRSCAVLRETFSIVLDLMNDDPVCQAREDEFDVHTLTREVICSLLESHPQKIEIILSLGSLLGEVKGDRQRVSNLLRSFLHCILAIPFKGKLQVSCFDTSGTTIGWRVSLECTLEGRESLRRLSVKEERVDPLRASHLRRMTQLLGGALSITEEGRSLIVELRLPLDLVSTPQLFLVQDVIVVSESNERGAALCEQMKVCGVERASHTRTIPSEIGGVLVIDSNFDEEMLPPGVAGALFLGDKEGDETKLLDCYSVARQLQDFVEKKVSGEVISHIDLPLFLKRCLNRRDIVVRVALEFKQQLERDVSALEELLLEGEVRELGALAHSLKGAASTVAAKQLTPLFSDLECAARGGHVEEIEDLLGKLPAAVQGWLQEAQGSIFVDEGQLP